MFTRENTNKCPYCDNDSGEHSTDCPNNPNRFVQLKFKPKFFKAQFNYQCPDCGGCYNEPARDIGVSDDSTGRPRCPYCGKRHLG